MKGIIPLKATLFPYLIYLAFNIIAQSYLYKFFFKQIKLYDRYYRENATIKINVDAFFVGSGDFEGMARIAEK